jgi:hypothetical protein
MVSAKRDYRFERRKEMSIKLIMPVVCVSVWDFPAGVEHHRPG